MNSSEAATFQPVPFEQPPRGVQVILYYVLTLALPVCLVGFGMIGNVLSFLIFRQQHYVKHITSLFMRLLSVFDTCVLIFHAVSLILFNHFTEYVMDRNYGILCKLGYFGTIQSHMSSNWTVTVMTIDRFLAVRYPLQAASWCTKGRAKRTLAVLVSISAVISAPGLFITSNLPEGEIQDSDKHPRKLCWFDPAVYPSWMLSIFFIVAGMWTVHFTLFTILVFNCLIIITLIQQRMRSRIVTSQNGTKKRDGQITILLLTATAIFLVTNTPWSVYDIIRHELNESLAQIIIGLSALLINANSAINFYAYCLFCRKFRQDLGRLLFGKKAEESAL
jgi:hypothetical protein